MVTACTGVMHTTLHFSYCPVQLREQLFEQEKKLLQSQNEWLNTELNSKSEILLKLQKDRVSNVCLLNHVVPK